MDPATFETLGKQNLQRKEGANIKSGIRASSHCETRDSCRPEEKSHDSKYPEGSPKEKRVKSSGKPQKTHSDRCRGLKRSSDEKKSHPQGRYGKKKKHATSKEQRHAPTASRGKKTSSKSDRRGSVRCHVKLRNEARQSHRSLPQEEMQPSRKTESKDSIVLSLANIELKSGAYDARSDDEVDRRMSILRDPPWIAALNDRCHRCHGVKETIVKSHKCDHGKGGVVKCNKKGAVVSFARRVCVRMFDSKSDTVWRTVHTKINDGNPHTPKK